MLGDGDDVFCASFLEEAGPGGGIEMLGFEERNEIFVAEFILRAVSRDMVFKFPGFGPVHFAGIPFGAEGGNGVNAPMDEDAEFGVLVPLGNFVLFEGLPVGTKGAAIGEL